MSYPGDSQIRVGMYGNVKLGNSLGAEVVRTLIFKGILQG